MMDDDFESELTEDEFYASITPRKLDKHTVLALWFQYRAKKKLVRGDFYISVAQSLLLHREYKVHRTEFQEQASREIEALVTGLREDYDGSSE
jgi:hypothetical protein